VFDSKGVILQEWGKSHQQVYTDLVQIVLALRAEDGSRAEGGRTAPGTASWDEREAHDFPSPVSFGQTATKGIKSIGLTVPAMEIH